MRGAFGIQTLSSSSNVSRLSAHQMQRGGVQGHQTWGSAQPRSPGAPGELLSTLVTGSAPAGWRLTKCPVSAPEAPLPRPGLAQERLGTLTIGLFLQA